MYVYMYECMCTCMNVCMSIQWNMKLLNTAKAIWYGTINITYAYCLFCSIYPQSGTCMMQLFQGHQGPTTFEDGTVHLRD